MRDQRTLFDLTQDGVLVEILYSSPTTLVLKINDDGLTLNDINISPNLSDIKSFNLPTISIANW